MPKIQDIMTRNPMTCQENDPVIKAVEVMKRQDVGVVPIVDQNNVCRGIVTDRDIVLQIVYNNQDVKTVPVKVIMSRDLVTCNLDDDLGQVIQQMQRRQIKRIVVVDQVNHCVGIISAADIAQKVKDPGGSLGELSQGVYGSSR
jgi:CBS domain-containing protein